MFNNLFNNFLKNIKALNTVFLLLVFLIAIVISDVSFAALSDGSSTDVDPSGIITIFCNVINQITNGVGKVISILILISMAIALFLGKITWGLAICVMVGMGLLFGASGVVDTIAPGNGTKNICEAVKQQ
jgi:type IV secretory pathway VirB2 component (pilin)